jgi:hypothetical protein
LSTLKETQEAPQHSPIPTTIYIRKHIGSHNDDLY